MLAGGNNLLLEPRYRDEESRELNVSIIFEPYLIPASARLFKVTFAKGSGGDYSRFRTPSYMKNCFQLLFS